LSINPINTDLDSKVLFHRTGLEIRQVLTIDEWQQLVSMCQGIQNATKWWIGDALHYGETAYGETYTQAIEDTGMSYKTLANRAWVSGKVELSRRRENLSWKHHAVVASLPPDKQDHYLDLAEQEQLSANALDDEIHGGADNNPNVPIFANEGTVKALLVALVRTAKELFRENWREAAIRMMVWRVKGEK
jgi:hypothetical protein